MDRPVEPWGKELEGKWISFTYERGSRAGLPRAVYVRTFREDRIDVYDEEVDDTRTYVRSRMSSMLMLDGRREAPDGAEAGAGPQEPEGPGAEEVSASSSSMGWLEALRRGVRGAAGSVGQSAPEALPDTPPQRARSREEEYRTPPSGGSRGAGDGRSAAPASAGGAADVAGPVRLDAQQEEGVLVAHGTIAAADWPVVCVLHNPELEGAVYRLIDEAEWVIDILQYLLCHKGIVSALSRAVRRGVRIRVILDEGQMHAPSATAQPLMVRVLREWGVAVRLHRPPRGGFAAQHQKTMLVDTCLYLCGSANLSENSLQNSVEAVVVTRGLSACEAAGRHFEAVWSASRPLEERDLQAGAEHVDRRKRQGRARSSSAGRFAAA